MSTSSAAFRNPKVIAEMIRELGVDKVTVAIDVDRNPSLPSGYEVFVDGGGDGAAGGLGVSLWPHSHSRSEAVPPELRLELE